MIIFNVIALATRNAPNFQIDIAVFVFYLLFMDIEYR